MRAVRDTDVDGIEILPVVVVAREFPARPSSVPDIREFVREHLSQTQISGDDIRTLTERVADVLLEAAGGGGAIQVSLRVLATRTEIDVLQTEGAARPGAAATANGHDGSGADPYEAVRVGAAVAIEPGPADGEGLVRTAPRTGVSFAQWLTHALRREGMTMEAAARQLQVSVKTASRWVGGATEPRLRDLSKIREIFGEVPFP